MLERFFQLPLAKKAALIATTLTAVACIVIVLAGYQGSKTLVQNSATLFGESLIQQLSREASNPLVQDDKLSLQALLNELVNSPIVNHGVIYDVENQLVTEAGEAADGLSLSASITFQDSIAGYAVITLNSPSLQQQASSLTWQLLGLSVLLLMLVYLLSSVPARYVSALLGDLKVIAAKGHGPSKLRIAYRGNDELQHLAEQIIKGQRGQNVTAQTNDSEHAVLSLEIANVSQLRHTMSRHDVREVVIECYKQLTVIGKLYDGHVTLRGANHFTAQFFPTDAEESFPFRALCAGVLIQQWLTSNQSPIALNLGLSLKEKSTGEILDNEMAMQEAIDDAKHAARVGNGHLSVTAAVAVHHSVSQRVNTQIATDEDQNNSVDRSLRIVKNLADPYDQLLARQLSTLSTQMT